MHHAYLPYRNLYKGTSNVPPCHLLKFLRENLGAMISKVFLFQIIFPLSCFDKGCADANDGNDPPIEVMVVQLELVRIDTAHSCVTETLNTSERKSVFLTSGLSMTNFSLTV